jgi:hypothetical protein
VETRALKARRERRENGEVAGESETENGHGRPAEKWAGLVLGWFSVLIRKKNGNGEMQVKTIHSSHPHSHLQIHRMSRRERRSRALKRRGLPAITRIPSPNLPRQLVPAREKGAARSAEKGRSSKGEGGAPGSREPIAPESRRPRRRLVEGRRHRIEPAAARSSPPSPRIEPTDAGSRTAAAGSRELRLHAVDLLCVGPWSCFASMSWTSSRPEAAAAVGSWVCGAGGE